LFLRWSEWQIGIALVEMTNRHCARKNDKAEQAGENGNPAQIRSAAKDFFCKMFLS